MDIFDPHKRSEIMRAVKSEDTKPEMLVRRLLHGAGYRYQSSKTVMSVLSPITSRNERPPGIGDCPQPPSLCIH
jgi:hypothetical protein